MTLGLADRQGDLLDDVIRFCDTSLAQCSIYAGLCGARHPPGPLPAGPGPGPGPGRFFRTVRDQFLVEVGPREGAGLVEL